MGRKSKAIIEAEEEARGKVIVNAVDRYKQESKASRRTREARNKRNWAAYFSQQDWSHKKKGQSKEFTPSTSMGVESVAAFVKRTLTGFGNFFSMEIVDESLMTSKEAANLLKHHLEDERTDFVDVVEQSIKIMLLSSVNTYKVRHENPGKRDFVIKIDNEKPERVYPDPTGRELYFIHEVVRDFYDVKKRAGRGEYDEKVIDKLQSDFVESDKIYEEERQKNHDMPENNFRRRVTLHEVHGGILDQQGNMVEEEIIATVANNRYLIKKPKKNPRFHGKNPFVMTSIIKVPDSVWHKALYDDAVRINLYINELQNLMLDGGLAAAHDVKAIRPDFLKDPEQASGGVPAGTTLLVKEDMPANMKVIETVKTGEVPPDCFNMLNVATRNFDMASMFNDIKAGLLSPRQVKATEVIEKEQATSQQLDGFARTVERAIDKVLRLVWAEIMQYRNNYLDLEHVIGRKASLALSIMSARERYDMFAKNTKFDVNGISSLITRGKNFQKLMIAIDTMFKNPILAEAFAKRFSADKIINKVFEGLDLDPGSIELEKGEEGINPETLQQLFGEKKTGTEAAAAGGRNPFPAERFPAGKENV